MIKKYEYMNDNRAAGVREGVKTHLAFQLGQLIKKIF